MSKKKAFYIDMDGTLARFHDADKMYIEAMWTPGFYVNLKPFENLVAGIKLFIDRNPEIEVNILSAVLDTDPPFIVGEKNEWFDKYLPEIDKEHRIFTRAGDDKSQYINMQEFDCFLLDDFNKNLYEFETAGGMSIKFRNDINHRGLGEFGGSKGNMWTGAIVNYDDSPKKICKDLETIIIGKEKTIISFLSDMEDKYGSYEDMGIEDDILVEYLGQKEMVRIPDGVEVIDINAFLGNETIKTVVFPDSVQTILSGAFAGCKTLKDVVLPNDLRTIERNAFSGCSLLENIKIPASVLHLHNQAFNCCENLQNIQIESGNKNYFSVNGIVFKPVTVNGLKQIEAFCCPCGKSGEIVLPDVIDIIAPEAFSNCTLITDIKLPVSLNEICDGAFLGCSSLKAIAIPDGVLKIGDNVFAECDSLSWVVFPDDIQEMGHGIFDGCKNLAEIVISDDALVRYCKEFNFLDEMFMTPCYNELKERYEALTAGKDILSVLEDANKRCGKQVAMNKGIEREKE